MQKFLTDNKINPSKVTTLTVNKVTATLANTALKFDALESASLLIDGTQWAGGAITVDASGNVLVGGVVAGNVNNQTLTLSTPKLSVKDLLSKTTLDYKLVIKTKKATPASACTANYAITIGYSL